MSLLLNCGTTRLRANPELYNFIPSVSRFKFEGYLSSSNISGTAVPAFQQWCAAIPNAGTGYTSGNRCPIGSFFSWVRLSLWTSGPFGTSKTIGRSNPPRLGWGKSVFCAFRILNYRHSARYQVQDRLFSALLHSTRFTHIAAVLRCPSNSSGLDKNWVGQPSRILGVSGT